MILLRVKTWRHLWLKRSTNYKSMHSVSHELEFQKQHMVLDWLAAILQCKTKGKKEHGWISVLLSGAQIKVVKLWKAKLWMCVFLIFNRGSVTSDCCGAFQLQMSAQTVRVTISRLVPILPMAANWCMADSHTSKQLLSFFMHWVPIICKNAYVANTHSISLCFIMYRMHCMLNKNPGIVTLYGSC